jgi:ketosteroid isomerase-like protein
MPTKSPRDESESLVRRYYEGFNARDTMGMLACLAEDVLHDVDQGERRKGKVLFARRFWTKRLMA